MLYFIAKIICKFCIQIYYGKIEVNGLSELPKGKPLLLACNHPTGFLEPIIIACIMDRDLHFITRGDLFSNKLLGPILRATHQIPIFRFKDGYGGLRKNNASIKAAENAIKDGGALLIFVEGKTEDIKMLKPLQKGMARISVSLHNDDFDHRIIPVGINFVDSFAFRSRVMLNFGKAINPHIIIDSAADQRAAFLDLNKNIFSRMKELLLHVSDRAIHPLHNRLINLKLAEVPKAFFPRIAYQTSTFSILKKVSERLDSKKTVDCNALEETVTSIGIQDSPLYQDNVTSLMDYIKLIMGFPFAFLGIVLNIIPVLIGVAIQRRYVKSREFMGPIRFSASMGVALLYYIGLVIYFVSTWGPKGFAILLGIPLAVISVYWIDIFMKLKSNSLLKPSKRKEIKMMWDQFAKS